MTHTHTPMQTDDGPVCRDCPEPYPDRMQLLSRMQEVMAASGTGWQRGDRAERFHWRVSTDVWRALMVPSPYDWPVSTGAVRAYGMTLIVGADLPPNSITLVPR